jgi:hypothetical protein
VAPRRYVVIRTAMGAARKHQEQEQQDDPKEDDPKHLHPEGRAGIRVRVHDREPGQPCARPALLDVVRMP